MVIKVYFENEGNKVVSQWHRKTKDKEKVNGIRFVIITSMDLCEEVEEKRDQ